MDEDRRSQSQKSNKKTEKSFLSPTFSHSFVRFEFEFWRIIGHLCHSFSYFCCLVLAQQKRMTSKFLDDLFKWYSPNFIARANVKENLRKYMFVWIFNICNFKENCLIHFFRCLLLLYIVVALWVPITLNEHFQAIVKKQKNL